jgi:flagellar basal body-associated protein FliL
VTVPNLPSLIGNERARGDKMRDIIILVAVYLVAAVLAIVGILGLLKHHTPATRNPVQEKVSSEDMLYGRGKEEEERQS